MLHQETIEKLKNLKLNGMLEALRHIQQTDSLQELSFIDGLGILVDQEVCARETNRLNRLSKMAKLRVPGALVENIDFQYQRNIKPEQLKWMVSGQWLSAHQNILLTGPTGLGKTYLACACAQLACRRGVYTRYFRLSKLLETMRIAHADGSYARFTSQLLKAQCLVIDDWGIDAITPERRADLLEIIDDHYDKRSIIIASQLAVEHWHDYIGDHTIADAILDRIVHQARIFEFDGHSMRRKELAPS